MTVAVTTLERLLLELLGEVKGLRADFAERFPATADVDSALGEAHVEIREPAAPGEGPEAAPVTEPAKPGHNSKTGKVEVTEPERPKPVKKAPARKAPAKKAAAAKKTAATRQKKG